MQKKQNNVLQKNKVALEKVARENTQNTRAYMIITEEDRKSNLITIML